MKNYDLTLAAEEDLRSIWDYSFSTWGVDQADRYLDQIEICFKAIGSRRVRETPKGSLPDDVRVHHCEHHYIFWLTGDQPIIIAVLHERMDLVSRLRDRL